MNNKTMKLYPLLRATVTLMFSGLLFSPLRAIELKSISRMVFGPDGVLFIADWKASSVYAVTLPTPTVSSAQHFNIMRLTPALATTLKSPRIEIEDLAMRPGTGEAYLGVNYGAKGLLAILKVTADGKVQKLDLKALASSTLLLKDPPLSNYMFWNKVPLRSLTVTDMKWNDGKLYIAGITNTDFSSALRIASYPFTQEQAVASVSIYHTSHDQIETRAPIREMSFINLDGKPYLVAAYTCTPLVTIPLDAIKDGAKITGKTIAELGYGNTPNGMLTYTAPFQGKPVDFVLVSNIERSPCSIPVSQIEAANLLPGMGQMVPFGSVEGVNPITLPMAGISRIDNQDESSFLVLRRNAATGGYELVTVDKGLYIRLSDFVAEFGFPRYSYKAGGKVPHEVILPLYQKLGKEEGFAPPPDQ